jgi:hypothetical protein
MREPRPAITPELKVSELLESYPELEAVLVGLSPSFQALKNPVLRRTVAKLATLQQVARVGNIGLGTLVNRLRAAAGQGASTNEDVEPAGAERPAWARDELVRGRFDARPLLAEGGHPGPAVMKELQRLGPGEVYVLVTPFEPAPLVDKAVDRGFEAWSQIDAGELVITWFRRP